MKMNLPVSLIALLLLAAQFLALRADAATLRAAHDTLHAECSIAEFLDDIEDSRHFSSSSTFQFGGDMHSISVDFEIGFSLSDDLARLDIDGAAIFDASTASETAQMHISASSGRAVMDIRFEPKLILKISLDEHSFTTNFLDYANYSLHDEQQIISYLLDESVSLSADLGSVPLAALPLDFALLSGGSIPPDIGGLSFAVEIDAELTNMIASESVDVSWRDEQYRFRHESAPTNVTIYASTIPAEAELKARCYPGLKLTPRITAAIYLNGIWDQNLYSACGESYDIDFGIQPPLVGEPAALALERPTGSLRVDLNGGAPPEGAMWSILFGEEVSWQDSGVRIDNVVAGKHTVVFPAIDGWIEPGFAQVEVQADTLTVLERDYTVESGTVEVNLPADSAAAGAQWRVYGEEAWLDSGQSAVVGVGTHFLELSDGGDWRPENQLQEFQIYGASTTTLEPNYIFDPAEGLITVEINPTAAADAHWRIGGGAWQASGETNRLTPGSYLLEFEGLSGWHSPPATSIGIADGLLQSIAASYIQEKGQLMAALGPANAVGDGAMWRIEDGDWLENGTLLSLPVGDYNLEAKNVAGWWPPQGGTVTVMENASTAVRMEYSLQQGAVRIHIEPPDLQADARWRLSGGAWQTSGSTVWTNPGNYSVQFSDVAGWYKPGDIATEVKEGVMLVNTSHYSTTTASLEVELSPAAAISAGAQWRVDAGPWKNSGQTVSGLSAGPHLVDFSKIAGWDGPEARQVDLIAGNIALLSIGYSLADGDLQIHLGPDQALAEGASWSVDASGVWLQSGSVYSNISAGTHYIIYDAPDGWIAPEIEEIEVAGGQTRTLYREFDPTRGKVNVLIEPDDAVVEGAMWRFAGGAWRDSGDVATTNANASYTIEFKGVDGWHAPTAASLSVERGSTTVATVQYRFISGSIRTYIGPPEAMANGAMWRLDTDIWRNPGERIDNLLPGDYQLSFREIEGWQAPLAGVAPIEDQSITTVTANYSRATGNLRIVLLPSEAIADGAHWRLAGGEWLESGTTVSNLAARVHVVEFASVPGWNDISSIGAEVTGGATSEYIASYTKDQSSLMVAINPDGAVDDGALWRVDGGGWLDSEERFFVAAGGHTVDFKELAKWNHPAPADCWVAQNNLLYFEANYTPKMGTLKVTIEPDEANTDGAYWSAGSVNATSGSEIMLNPGSYTITFNDIVGWDEPAEIPVEITSTGYAEFSAAYSPWAAYVWHEGSNTPPYDSWSKAAHNIDDAVASAGEHYSVFIATGTYLIDSAIDVGANTHVRGVGRPGDVIVDGAGITRCFNISGTNAMVSDLTVTGGADAGVYVSDQGRLERCIVSGNSSAPGANGGGVIVESDGEVWNCLISGNRCDGWGGGIYINSSDAGISHCTITGNTAEYPAGGIYASGASTIRNSIIYHNTDNYYTGGVAGDNHWGAGYYYYDCTIPLPYSQYQSIYEPPEFLDRIQGDFRLTPGSPAIDSGTHHSAVDPVVDISGLERPVDGDGDGSARFDLGCHEYHGALQDSDNDGLPDSYESQSSGTNPMLPDTDYDGSNDGDEDIAGTNPLDDNSRFSIESLGGLPDLGEIVISWPSVIGRHYTVQRRPTLQHAWSDIPGYIERPGTGYDMFCTNSSPYWTETFIRIEVIKDK